MKHPKQLLAVLLMAAACTMQAQRSEALLEKNWKFSKGDFKEASQPEFNDTKGIGCYSTRLGDFWSIRHEQ